MKTARALSGALAVLALAHIARFRWHFSVGQALAEAAQRFERRGGNGSLRILVVGDSSAVGTGADAPQDSVAGRLAKANPQVEIWNVAENGLRTAGLAERLRALDGSRFDAILIHIGVNDIVRFTPLPLLRIQIAEALGFARAVSDHVFLVTGGNIGMAPALPPGLRWVVTRRAREVRALFIDAATAAGVVYVDMFNGEVDRPVLANPARYFARDGFHPNSEGYALWCEFITAAMKKAGVGLA